MMKKILALPLILITVACTNNKKEMEPECNDIFDVSYANDISPILSNNGCFGCHNEGFASGNVQLQPFSDLQDEALNGKLLCSVEWTNGCDRMPQNSPQIDQCDIELIRVWINEGAKEN